MIASVWRINSKEHRSQIGSFESLVIYCVLISVLFIGQDIGFNSLSDNCQFTEHDLFARTCAFYFRLISIFWLWACNVSGTSRNGSINLVPRFSLPGNEDVDP